MHVSLSLSSDVLVIVGIVIMLICMAMMSKSATVIAAIVVMLSLAMFYFARNNKNAAEGLHASGAVSMQKDHVSTEDTINIPVTTIINEPISAAECDRNGFFDRSTDSAGKPVDGHMSMAEEYPLANKDVDALTGEKEPTDAYPWGSNQSYTDCYPGPNRELNGCNINAYVCIDEANTRQVAMRTRDKKVIDGAVSKNANYYKKNFGNELSESENKRWWGNDEY